MDFRRRSFSECSVNATLLAVDTIIVVVVVVVVLVLFGLLVFLVSCTLCTSVFSIYFRTFNLILNIFHCRYEGWRRRLRVAKSWQTYTHTHGDLNYGRLKDVDFAKRQTKKTKFTPLMHSWITPYAFLRFCFCKFTKFKEIPLNLDGGLKFKSVSLVFRKKKYFSRFLLWLLLLCN